MNLTAKAIDALKWTGTPRKYGDTGTGSVPGLFIRISKNTKTWTVKYDRNGSKAWQAIGRWPEVSIALARDKAREFKKQIAEGHDPKAVEDKTEQATLGHLLDSYYEDCVERGVKSLPLMRSYRNKIQKRYRDLIAGEVDAATIHEILHPIAAQGKGVTANRVRTHLSSAFNWALRQEFALDRNRDLSFGIRRNVVMDVPALKSAEKPADVHLTMRNLAAMWTHIDEYNSPVTVMAVRAHIAAAGLRMFDSTHRRWEEFISVEYQGEQVPCILIPKDKVGNKDRIIPCSKHYLQIMKQLAPITRHKSEVMFPQRSATKTPLTTIGIGQATRKIREKYPACGSDYSSRFVRRASKTHMGNAGLDRMAMDIYHGHQLPKQFSKVATKNYDFQHYLGYTLRVIEVWDRLLGDAIAEYQAELESHVA